MLSGKLGIFLRLHHESLMRPIREAARLVAKELIAPGMKEFFTRWGDNVFREGTSIKEEREAIAYVEERKKDIESLVRQAKIQHMYENVEIPI
jgi:hypothetical protein